MTPEEARAIALEELNKVLANNCTPAQKGPLPTLLVGSPLTIAERLTAAAMAAHLWARVEWPVITGGTLVEELKNADKARVTRERVMDAHGAGFTAKYIPSHLKSLYQEDLTVERVREILAPECRHPGMTGIRAAPVPCHDCGKVVF